MADEKQVNIVIKSKYEGKGDVDAKKGLEKVQQQANKTNEAMEKGASTAQDRIVTLSSAINVMKAAWAGARGVVNWFFESIEMANKNARSVNMLAAAYNAVGFSAKGALDQAKAFASEMQNLTGIADEVFLDGQRLLANYGIVGQKAQESIRAAYALSVGIGTSLESAITLVAKAAAGSTASLSRYGIVLGDGVKEGEKFDAVLKQINDKFGASAQATLGDMTTKVGALKESWGDFREEVGTNLTPALIKLLEVGTQVVNVLGNLFGQKRSTDVIAYEKNLEKIAEINKQIDYWRSKVYNKGYNQKAVNDRLYSLEKELKFYTQAQEALDKQNYEKAKQAKIDNEIVEKQAEQINNARTINKVVESRAKKESEILAKVQEQVNAAQAKGAQTTREQTVKFSADYSNMSGGNLVQEAIRLDNERRLQEQIAEIRRENLEKQAADAKAIFEKSNEAELEANAAKYETALIQLGEFNAQQLEQQETYNAQRQAMEQNLVNFNQTAANAYAKTQTQNFKNAQALFSQIGQLATNENKKLAAVGKAGSIAQATINTYEGATKALAQGGFFGIAMAAAVIASGLAQVAQISNVKLAEGGLVKAVTGGVPAIIGEGGSDEAVLPLNNSKALQRIGGAIAEEGGNMGAPVQIYIQTQAVGGVEAILEQLTDASRNGVVQALEFANLNYKVGAEQQGFSV